MKKFIAVFVFLLMLCGTANAMVYLKQSTAATIKMGAFVDDTDGKTAETALTISQADIRLAKNGGDIAQSNNTAGATHDELGFYGVPLDTTDTNTLGNLRVIIRKTGALPVWQDFMVVTANVYDSLCSTDYLQVDVVQVSGATEDIATETKQDVIDGIVDAILVDTAAMDTSAKLRTLLFGSDTAGATAANQTTIIGYIDTEIAAILADTNELQTNQGNWLTATGFSTHSAADVLNVNISAYSGVGYAGTYLKNLFDNQDNWTTATGFSTHSAADVWESGTRTLSAFAFTPDVNMTQILGTTLTETNTLADSFSYLLDVATPAKTMNDIGVAGAGLSAEDVWTYATRALTDKAGFTISGTKQTLDDLNDITTAQVNAEVDTALTDYDAPTATELAAAFTEIKGATWSSVTDTLEAIRDRGDSAWITSTLSASGVWANVTRTLTAGTKDSVIDAILADTAELQTNQSNWNTATGFSTHSAADVWAVVTRTLTAGTKDTEIDAIKAKTDNLPTDPASASVVAGLIATVQADLDNPAQYKADVTGMATTANQTTIINHLTDVKGATFSGTTDSLEAISTAVAGVSGGSAPTAAEVADAVWDEVISGHLTLGSTGYALNAAGAAGDPWSVALPASYTDSQAGGIIWEIKNSTDGDKENGSYSGIENLIRRSR